MTAWVPRKYVAHEGRRRSCPPRSHTWQLGGQDDGFIVGWGLNVLATGKWRKHGAKSTKILQITQYVQSQRLQVFLLISEAGRQVTAG